jgi:hypothetical protein
VIIFISFLDVLANHLFISLLPLSLCYDVTLFNGKSTRQPSVNQFFDDICERLRQAIEIYEKMPLSKIFSLIVYFDLNGVSSEYVGSSC